MARSAIFLSGWEYNRILEVEPDKPKVSALPARALWEGASQFWLFSTVYCTRESLLGEIAASEDLGWATGYIFDDLRRRGFLKTFEWRSLREENPLRFDELRLRHQILRERYDEKALLRLLEKGEEEQLEAIKLDLMRPIFEHLDCVSNVSPNSIIQWVKKRDEARFAKSQKATSRAIQLLAEPLAKRIRTVRTGTRLCLPPGTGVGELEVAAQRQVEKEIQKPMIPDLLAGILPQPDYHTALKDTANVYAPIDRQLRADFATNVGKLERLRDLAQKYLWPDLHGEWLPRLEEDPEFLSEFEALLSDALMRARYDPYLEHMTDLAINVVSGAVFLAVAGVANVVGQDPLTSGTAAGTAGLSTRRQLVKLHDARREATNNLTLFYQKARAST